MLSLISLLIACLAGVLPSARSVQHCRCTYGDACWPSSGDFNRLEQQLSRSLIYPSPYAKPCYINATSPACTAIMDSRDDGNWRASQPGAMQSPNFETYTFANGTVDACYLETSLGTPCHQGSVSVVGVDAHTVEDIQAAVAFASQHNLRLVVKNTGHDYLGRSDGRGSFSVWTHNLKNVTVHSTFRPSGAPDGDGYEYAMTLGAGVQWHEAYAVANASGRTIVGGVSDGGSVGAAGGWLLGGGHSALSPAYGLGVDNVLEISLVTSTGAHIIANEYQHADLFWALRGGGGGTFGVVTSVTYRTHAATPVVAAILIASAEGSQSNPTLREAFTELVRITPQLTDFGWGGYTIFEPANDTTTFLITYLIPNVSWSQANATINPYFEYVQALASNSSGQDTLTVLTALTQPFPSFYDWFTTIIPKVGEVGVNVEIGSRLLPRSTLENEYEHVAQELLELPDMNYYLVAGGAVSRVDPSKTGLNPAWRQANTHVVIGTSWADGATSAEIEQKRGVLRANTAKLRALAPQSGAYFNEASLYEPNAKEAFFGSHYNRLRTIKKLYDPRDLFVVAEGVGSDEWTSDLKCRV
ncbi:FAD-binding domain-containing protein [Cubamyces sp. BRFM 1775]|nr:FAD-binding domain-containing protein [Cubamyces sp. BRFM 1775]